MKPRMLLVLLILVVNSGCNYYRDKVSATEERRAGEGWYAWLDRTVFQPRCVQCHAGASAHMGVDLTSYLRVMGSGVVIPFRPKQSRLFITIREGTMPKGSPLSESQIERVQKWIEKGSPENDPVSQPPPPPPKPEPNFKWLHANVFSTSCLPCHGGDKPKGDTDLTSYKKLMDSPGMMLKPADPESPDTSGIYHQVSEGLMPPAPAERLSPEIQKALRQWIQAGAKDD